MNTDKKYVMIVTSEDERYGRNDVQLDFFCDDPWEGILEAVVFGDTYEELSQNGKYEGLFQQTYEMKTGRRISYGVIDDLTPKEEIEELEEKEKLNMIKEIRQSKEKIEFDGVDEDTILVDTIETWDFEMTGIGEDIFNIYEKSKDKKSLEQLFFEFTGLEFSEYLEKCIKRINKDD